MGGGACMGGYFLTENIRIIIIVPINFSRGYVSQGTMGEAATVFS